MRLPLLVALLLLVALGRGSDFTSIAQFGLTYLTCTHPLLHPRYVRLTFAAAVGWSSTNCSSTCCNSSCCTWPGVTFDSPTCFITKFDVSAPVGFVGGDTFPTYIWDAAQSRNLNVLCVLDLSLGCICSLHSH